MTKEVDKPRVYSVKHCDFDAAIAWLEFVDPNPDWYGFKTYIYERFYRDGTPRVHLDETDEDLEVIYAEYPAAVYCYKKMRDEFGADVEWVLTG